MNFNKISQRAWGMSLYKRPGVWYNKRRKDVSGMGHSEAWREAKQKLVADYHERNLTAQKGGIVFTGSSLMEQFPVEEWMAQLPEPRPVVYNRGIGGYTTADLMPILDICVFELAPKKVFINIGTNDLKDADKPIGAMIENYDWILTQIEQHLPGVPIYLMAYYPVNPDVAEGRMKEVLKIRTNEKIRLANREVQTLAEKHGQRYIDLNRNLTDEMGRLKAEYTVEGMHIKPAGYRAIWDDLMSYVLE